LRTSKRKIYRLGLSIFFVLETIKAWLETPVSFLITDVFAALPNDFLVRLVRQDNTIKLEGTTPYSQAILAGLAIGYGVASYFLADYAVKTESVDAKYLSLGASAALLLQAIADAVIAALIGKEVPTTHPATKLIH